MKFLDLINESTDDYIQKQIKKAKTIYKAFKKGTIGGDNPQEPHFSYELSDDFLVDVNNRGIVMSIGMVKLKHLNRGCLLHSSDYMGGLIRKRFNHFGIVLTSIYGDRYFEYDVEEWQSPINEEIKILNRYNLTDSEIKKVKLIYKLHKKGHFHYSKDALYGYILPDDYVIYKDQDGNVCVKLTGEEGKDVYYISRIKFNNKIVTNLDKEIDQRYQSLRDWVRERIIEKFNQFNITFNL